MRFGPAAYNAGMTRNNHRVQVCRLLATGALLSCCFGLVLVLGCSRNADHDHDHGHDHSHGHPHDHAAPAHDPDDVPITEADVKMPATYAAAVPQVKAYCAAIRTAIDANTPSKAHRPLDELDIVLRKLIYIARDSGVPKKQWETVNVTARELRILFNQIHSAIDDGRAPDYKAVSEPIEAALERLTKVVSP